MSNRKNTELNKRSSSVSVPIQVQRPLAVIEHLVVVVGGDFDGVSLPEKTALGHMQAHQALFPLGRRLVERYKVRTGTRQSLCLRTVIFSQHVPLVIEPVPVFDGALVGHHHPHVLVRRQVFEVVRYGNAFRAFVLGSPLAAGGIGEQVHRIHDDHIGRVAVDFAVFGNAVLDVHR